MLGVWIYNKYRLPHKVKKKNIPKKVHKQKTPLMWGYSAMLETESVLSCLFLVWDNAAPKVMPVRLVLFLGNLKKIR